MGALVAGSFDAARPRHHWPSHRQLNHQMVLKQARGVMKRQDAPITVLASALIPGIFRHIRLLGGARLRPA